LNAANRKRYFFSVAAGVAVVVLTGASEKGSSIQRVVREAENLSANQDRQGATNLIVRQLKKTAASEDLKFLKEKLHFFSRYFYTEKGFQAYLVGKELFDKKKFSDALDKFMEADELEKDNVDVLHYLTLNQLALGKPDLAEATNKRAMLMCPGDLDLTRNQLTIQVALEKWTEALKTAEVLMRDYGDSAAQTLKDRGLALLKLESKAEARRYFEQAQQKDRGFPEPYYWLSTLKENIEAQKFLTKYVELCKDRLNLKYTREPNLCLYAAEAEKKLK
jgi:tetratricopeptide (TPR) repeat protein